MFGDTSPTAAETRAPRAGDDIVSPADVVMDRAFTVDGKPESVWPWLVQLGKGRAGWYLTRTVERFLPASRRAARAIDARWQDLRIGDVVPDYGGRDASFTVAEIDPPHSLVYRSTRGHTQLTWSITCEPATGGDGAGRTRVCARLRLAPVRRVWLARTMGGFFDRMTVAAMAAGLQERVSESGRSR